MKSSFLEPDNLCPKDRDFFILSHPGGLGDPSDCIHGAVTGVGYHFPLSQICKKCNLVLKIVLMSHVPNLSMGQIAHYATKIAGVSQKLPLLWHGLSYPQAKYKGCPKSQNKGLTTFLYINLMSCPNVPNEYIDDTLSTSSTLKVIHRLLTGENESRY